MDIKKIIFFDVETNGLKGSSVLSISAMKISYNLSNNEMINLGEFDRFYFRALGEEISEKAISVNGLTDEEIERRRSLSNVSYPKRFLEDINGFFEFCDGATHFVAHNIRFDRDFIPFELEYQFDTMLENVSVLKLPGRYENSYKWPTLNECARFYKVPLDSEQLHQSMYDVKTMARVFYMMNKKEETRKRIIEYVRDNIGTKM